MLIDAAMTTLVSETQSIGPTDIVNNGVIGRRYDDALLFFAGLGFLTVGYSWVRGRWAERERTPVGKASWSGDRRWQFSPSTLASASIIIPGALAFFLPCPSISGCTSKASNIIQWVWGSDGWRLCQLVSLSFLFTILDSHQECSPPLAIAAFIRFHQQSFSRVK